MAKSLTEIFDSKAENSPPEPVTLPPDVPRIEKDYDKDYEHPFGFNWDRNDTAILDAETAPRYEPFTNRKPLDCSLLLDRYDSYDDMIVTSVLKSGVGTICNPCGVKCTGKLIPEP